MSAPGRMRGQNRVRAGLVSCALLALALNPAYAASPDATTNSATTSALSSFPLPDAPQAAPPASLAPNTPVFAPARDYPLMAASQPTSLLLSSFDGGIWFAASNLSAIGRLDRATGAVTYFPLGTGTRPYAIAEAPDRSIYAVDRALNVLHRLTPENGVATRIAMPPDLPFLDLAALRIDLHGKLWFSGASGWLGSHDPATGRTDISSHEDLQGLVWSAGNAGGTIWFVAGKTNRMIRIEPQRSRFASAVLPAEIIGVRGAATGANGAVWISGIKSATLSRYSGRGSWRTVRLPWPDARPQALLVRADGSVIAADTARRKLIRYRPDLERFDEVGDLGSGGNIRAMIDLGDAVAVADMGGDSIRIFPDDPPKEN